MADPVSISILVDYIYNYALTFFICLLGSFVKDAYETVTKKTPISIIKILISSLFTSFTMCALDEYIEFNFSLYMLMSFLFGVWGFTLLGFAFNIKVIGIFIKNIFKEISNPIAKGVSNSLKEIQDEENKEQNDL